MATIVTKNSSTASAVPTTSDLVQGELAVNLADKRIFTEDHTTTIVELGTNPSSITTATATVTGTLTANGTFASSNAVLTGGTVNGIVIGGTTPQAITGTTVTASTGFVGGLTGNVTGNLTGNVTGNVTGNLTGNVTGNVTASSGTTTLNDLVVNGTADFTNTKLTNITTPTVGTDAANKSYVDDTVAAVIDAAPAALDTLNELAAALGDDANFAGTVTTALATKLPLAGGTMTGAIAMGTSKITGLGDPTSAQDAATKTYVDTADALKLNLTGGTMSGAIAMGTNKITGVGDPTLAQDAATKAYTDSILGSATSAADSAAAAATAASNASTSESNASDSADAAAASAVAAAASYDAFDDRYLGDKASDPTLDNDGNALLTGALYFNTTSDDMKVYNGSAWQVTAINPADPTFTGTVTADGLSLGDNDKAQFGNSNDLQIYHDGSNSVIKDNGTGNLLIQGATDIVLEDTSGANYFRGVSGSYVRLYHNNSTKLETTATGIDVTGTATMDALDISTSLSIGNDTNTIASTASLFFDIDSNDNQFNAVFNVTSNNKTENLFNIDEGGDISFYEDTGTTPKFFWDASEERLGIGTSSPSGDLHVNDDGGTATIVLTGDSISQLSFGDSADIAVGFIRYTHSGNYMTFRTGGSGEDMRIDSSGNLLVGKTATGITTAGIELRADNAAYFTRDSGIPILVNRETNDGDIIQLRKDNTTVGSIGTKSGDLAIGTGDTALAFYDAGSYILPYNTSTFLYTNNSIALGNSNYRFKDLYLSGTANVANVKETVYALSGTALDPANGGIQTKTLAANTTFTDSLASGESLVLQLEAGASYTVTWPTMQWVTSGGNVAPTLTAKDTLVFWKVSSTLYGAYTGSYV